jgi:hypothetical protein
MTNTPEKLWVLPLWGQDYPQDCRVSEEKEDDDSQEYIRADIVIKALEECQEEIDNYVRQEYQHDHSVQERYRQRGFSCNPARIALESLKETNK